MVRGLFFVEITNDPKKLKRDVDIAFCWQILPDLKYQELAKEWEIDMDETIWTKIERLGDEEQRQNKRLDTLEQNMDTQQKIAISVEKLAIYMEQMFKEQEKQGVRLDKLEGIPAEQWSNVKHTIINTIVGAGAGAFISGFFYLIAQNIK